MENLFSLDETLKYNKSVTLDGIIRYANDYATPYII